MKRLTSKGFRLGKDNSDLLPSYESIYHRLFAIEGILGDEYDLDRLRELAQADREVEDAKTLLRIFPEWLDSVSRDNDGRVTLAAKGAWRRYLNSDAFPSIRPGQSVTLDKIIEDIKC